MRDGLAAEAGPNRHPAIIRRILNPERGFIYMTDKSRRQFLHTAAIALTAPMVSAAEPVIGMIFPPANYPVPPEARLLYPKGVTFLAEGLAFNG
jgi:hypothetical protein